MGKLEHMRRTLGLIMPTLMRTAMRKQLAWKDQTATINKCLLLKPNLEEHGCSYLARAPSALRKGIGPNKVLCRLHVVFRKSKSGVDGPAMKRVAPEEIKRFCSRFSSHDFFFRNLLCTEFLAFHISFHILIQAMEQPSEHPHGTCAVT